MPCAPSSTRSTRTACDANPPSSRASPSSSERARGGLDAERARVLPRREAHVHLDALAAAAGRRRAAARRLRRGRGVVGDGGRGGDTRAAAASDERGEDEREARSHVIGPSSRRRPRGTRRDGRVARRAPRRRGPRPWRAVARGDARSAPRPGFSPRICVRCATGRHAVVEPRRSARSRSHETVQTRAVPSHRGGRELGSVRAERGVAHAAVVPAQHERLALAGGRVHADGAVVRGERDAGAVRAHRRGEEALRAARRWAAAPRACRAGRRAAGRSPPRRGAASRRGVTVARKTLALDADHARRRRRRAARSGPSRRAATPR